MNHRKSGTLACFIWGQFELSSHIFTYHSTFFLHTLLWPSWSAYYIQIVRYELLVVFSLSVVSSQSSQCFACWCLCIMLKCISTHAETYFHWRFAIAFWVPRSKTISASNRKLLLKAIFTVGSMTRTVKEMPPSFFGKYLELQWTELFEGNSRFYM